MYAYVVRIHRMLCNSGNSTFVENPYVSRGLLSKSVRSIYASPGSDNAKSYRSDGPSFLNNIDDKQDLETNQ